MICSKCNGKRWIPEKTHGYGISCPLCRAKKYLNWLECIFGVNDNDGGKIVWYSPSDVERIYKKVE